MPLCCWTQGRRCSLPSIRSTVRRTSMPMLRSAPSSPCCRRCSTTKIHQPFCNRASISSPAASSSTVRKRCSWLPSAPGRRFSRSTAAHRRSAHASEGRDSHARQRVCDQRFQFAPLGRSDPHLRGGLPAWQGRPARARLQHALDGLARCRHLPHRLAWGHLPLPRRQAQRVPRWPAAAHLRSQPNRLGDRAGGRRGVHRSRTALGDEANLAAPARAADRRIALWRSSTRYVCTTGCRCAANAPRCSAAAGCCGY